MSDQAPERPAPDFHACGLAIVASRYNPRYVQGLIDGALAELAAVLPHAKVELHQAPGAFEVPLLAQALLRRTDIDAVLAFGVIIRGQTSHADLIGSTITDSLQRLALEAGKPVIHEVLLLENQEQAAQRCLHPEMNRGVEAARAAAAMLEAMRKAGASHG